MNLNFYSPKSKGELGKVYFIQLMFYAAGSNLYLSNSGRQYFTILNASRFDNGIKGLAWLFHRTRRRIAY
ncbi:MAG: hypothetical protein CMQ41_06105 [Gammaproteobacteria bacterium]|nr:hypothetical protein [Gammaproteobacteria bacterium]|tara:strand:+ start:3782 stop:3991 length:210 start_codon:yes stop_codon:yes gene_type:complete